MKSHLSTAGTAQTASSTSTSTIKPLTRDKKGSKGSTVGTANKGKSSGPPRPPRPNLVLPTFEDTFDRPPRSLPLRRSPATSPSGLKKAVTASLSYFFSSSATSRPRSNSTDQTPSLKGKEREVIGDEHERLPKASKIVGSASDLGQAGRIAVIGVHGWFIQGYLSKLSSLLLLFYLLADQPHRYRKRGRRANWHISQVCQHDEGFCQSILRRNGVPTERRSDNSHTT